MASVARCAARRLGWYTRISIRSYDRHLDIEDPDHPKALLEQRRNAREQRLLRQFLSLSRHAQAYYEGIEQRSVNPRPHLRKIVALSEIYGVEAVNRAIQDGIAFAAFRCEYIANLLEMRARETPEPGALHLTRRQDLLETMMLSISLPTPDTRPSLDSARPRNLRIRCGQQRRRFFQAR